MKWNNYLNYNSNEFIPTQTLIKNDYDTTTTTPTSEFFSSSSSYPPPSSGKMNKEEKKYILSFLFKDYYSSYPYSSDWRYKF
jgi:hypothetical protein